MPNAKSLKMPMDGSAVLRNGSITVSAIEFFVCNRGADIFAYTSKDKQVSGFITTGDIELFVNLCRQVVQWWEEGKTNDPA